MVRTVISLDPADKAWLDRKAREQEVPMTEIVRRAVRRMREQEGPDSLTTMLERTRGIWTEGDGLEYQLRIRREWDRE
jgi:hypothetical protein